MTSHNLSAEDISRQPLTRNKLHYPINESTDSRRSHASTELHNLSLANHAIRDPKLTDFGEKQCAELSRTFPDLDSVDLIVASPLRRTIYTALLGFAQIIPRCGKVIVLPEAQETGDTPCDTGSDPQVLEDEFADKPVDLGLLTQGWNTNEGIWAPTLPAIEKRAREAREWLKARPENHIVLITHGGFVHYLMEDWTGYRKSSGTGWANVEYRSYEFKGDDQSASIEETSRSEERRRGTEKSLTETERIKLKDTARKTFLAEEFADSECLIKRR